MQEEGRVCLRRNYDAKFVTNQSKVFRIIENGELKKVEIEKKRLGYIWANW